MNARLARLDTRRATGLLSIVFLFGVAAAAADSYERPRGNLTWENAAERCSSQGQALCTRQQICPGGAGSQPIHGRPEGDVWMAVGDSPNAWISIGSRFDERLCRLHEELGGPPGWGVTTGPEAVTGVEAAMKCCPSASGYLRPSGSQPWNALSSLCAQQGARLCTQSQVCPEGRGAAPTLGRPEGDVWMAVGDHPNAWISIGSRFDERLCRLHEELGGPPGWGTTTGPQAVTGNPAAARCCDPRTPVAPVRTATVPRTRAPLADGCYALKSRITGQYLSLNTAPGVDLPYFANRPDAREWESFRLVNTLADRYHLLGFDAKFVAAVVEGGGGIISKETNPGAWAEWQVEKVPGTSFYTLRAVAGRSWLGADVTLAKVVVGKPAPGEWEHWTFEPAAACLPVPAADEGSTNAVGTVPASGSEIFGMADLHSHVFANLAFGERGFHGSPFSPFGLAGALPPCGRAHGEGGVLDLVGAGASGQLADLGVGHRVQGYPMFDGWPEHGNVNHQQLYYKWLERAHLGGLRLIVMLAVNNEVLCRAANLFADCDDMNSVRRQFEGAKTLEEFIDGKSGGPGRGWFRIVYTPAEARNAIREGKMAVVLGAEVDTLFGCGEKSEALPVCSKAHMARQLDEFHALGLRYVFPVHVFNNGFAGAALYNPLFNAANKAVNGTFFQATDCKQNAGRSDIRYDANADFAAAAAAGLGSFISLVSGGSTDLGYPKYAVAPGGHCNPRGLTQPGIDLVNALMDRGIAIDTDHMSALALEATLKIAERRNYPLIAGHAAFSELAGEGANEFMRTKSDLERIRNLGGVVAMGPGHGTAGAYSVAYKYAAAAMGGNATAGIPLGSDFNGWVKQPCPRFGPKACEAPPGAPAGGPEWRYPFYLNGVRFDELRAGAKVFNYNRDGLANVGLLPDFVHDLESHPISREELAPLFRGAEAFIRSWEKMVGEARVGAR